MVALNMLLLNLFLILLFVVKVASAYFLIQLFRRQWRSVQLFQVLHLVSHEYQKRH